MKFGRKTFSVGDSCEQKPGLGHELFLLNFLNGYKLNSKPPKGGSKVCIFYVKNCIDLDRILLLRKADGEGFVVYFFLTKIRMGVPENSYCERS